jgi:Flp pilus assembly protein TadD
VDLERTVARIDRARESIRAHIDADAIHAFTKAVNDLGHFDYQSLQRKAVNHAELVKETIGYLRTYLETNPEDAVALNNLGVLLGNNGERAQPRRLIKAALKLAPDDANIHNNLRILDISARKPKAKWHEVPEGAQGGDLTLTAFFDPHGM